MVYKHYSFDLWFTLLKSNPEFKKQRALYFFKHYNPLQKTIEQVELVFRQVDIMCNSINEKTGDNIDAEEMYLMVIATLNNYSLANTEVDLKSLYQTMEQLLFNYMPQVYCPNTLPTLDNLKQKTQATFNILSNTAFVKGGTLRQVLNHVGLAPYFNFQLYSCELGFSKPNPKIFNFMLQEAALLQPNKLLLPQQCLHIGDNVKADIWGAAQLNIASYQINTNQNTILNLL
jgi:putative hydrolase of the HAD superfamily